MMWLLITYLFSAGMFLVFYLLCSWLNKDWRKVRTDNVWITAAFPLWNTYSAFMCMGAFLFMLYDKTKEIFKFLKEEIQLMKFSWKLKQEIKKDEWFNQMKNDLKRYKNERTK